ncbi:MAG: right-handed parallel beta-helix repeat-containing protein, partial [Ruminococcus sp.]|nr:right-handed parallel beta-helix repeat-containing protein [Ruminococcus sp.]
MIQKIKKPVSILLTVLMVFSVFAVVPFTTSAAENGLYVNNVYANTTTSGNGWSFDTQTNTLTLENYNFSGVGSAPPYDSTVIMYYPQNGTLTINLKGTNTIVQGNGTNRTWWGIYCRSDLVITGDGTLNISTTDGGYRGAAIYGEKNITITGNCTVNAASGTVTNGPQGHGICHSDNAVLSIGENANVTSTGPNDNTVIAASVTSGGTTMRYAFADAVKAWNSAANGATLTLLADVSTSSTVGVSGTKTLDLNGHELKMTGNDRVISVPSGASLTLNDVNGNTGKITGGHSDRGAGVRNDGNFTMNGGTITGNTATAHGGGIYTIHGDFIMNGGIITNNTADGVGGGVCASGPFTMNNGKITNNKANGSGGGGVYVDSAFVMNNGEISGNIASDNGGGVCVNKNTFTFKNGIIEGNVANNGGGVSLTNSNCYCNMSGGTIQYNCGYGNTGGVLLVNNNNFTMSGGTIQYNVGKNFGGIGISAAQPKVSGTAVVKDNVIFSDVSRTNTKITKTDSGYTLASGGTPCDIKNATANGLKINIPGALENGAKIGIFNNSQTAVFTNGYKTNNPNDDPADYFFCNDTNYLVKTDFNGEVQLRLNGSSVASVTVGETTIEYASFAEALNAWTNGSTLTLLADVSTSSTVGVSGTKTLDLNGYGIKTTGGVAITVNDGADLTMKDSAPTRTGTGTNRPNGVEGGYLTGFNGGSNSACVVIYAGKLTMDGGSITGNIGRGDGAGVILINNKANEFIMNGGSITNNKAGVGAGVYCFNTGKVTMNGGIISDNVSTNASALSGGMLLHGSLTMTGGTITRNTVGVRVWQRASVVNLSGNARITGNTVNGTAYGNLDMSGGLASQNCVKVTGTLGDDALIGITMKTPGVFTGSTDTSYNDTSKFFSDNSSYIVGKNADGQLELAARPQKLIAGHTLTLDGNIGINYYIDPSAAGLDPGQSGTLKVDFAWANNDPLVNVAAQSKTVEVNSSNYTQVGDLIKVTCKVCAAEMSCDVKATVALNNTTETE